MSVLKVVEAVPSRVIGVVQFLLNCKGMVEEEERFKALMSPPSLGEGEMISKVVNECIKLGLMFRNDSSLQLAPCVAEMFPGRKLIRESLAVLIVQLIGNPDNAENHDLCRVLTWCLAQDPGSFQGDYEGMQAALLNQVGEDRLEVRAENRFDQLCYWAAFLGFGWTHALSDAAKAERLVPDPTRYLGWQLPQLFPKGRNEDVPLPRLHDRLAGLCPIFPGGLFWQLLTDSEMLPPLASGHLPGSLSLAWMRLRDRREVSLSNLSDASVLVLPLGETVGRYSHARWLLGTKGVG